MKRLARHLQRLRACFAGLPDPRRGPQSPIRHGDSRHLGTHRIPLAIGAAAIRSPKTSVRALAEHQLLPGIPPWDDLMSLLATGHPATQPP